MPKAATPTLSEKEVKKFNDLAAEWWDESGPMAPLHRMNPVRMEFIAGTLSKYFKQLKNINILDVGCGGGLVAEPLARLGARVTAIDGAGELVEIARAHARSEGLAIDYRNVLTDTLLKERQKYDIITALEVIEHVPDQEHFVRDIASLLKPGGVAIFSTLNRSAASLAFGVVAAEYILRWLPAGTHNWKSFVKPSELFHLCETAGLKPVQTMGLTYHPLQEEFSLDESNLNINYFMVAEKR